MPPCIRPFIRIPSTMRHHVQYLYGTRKVPGDYGVLTASVAPGNTTYTIFESYCPAYFLITRSGIFHMTIPS